MEKYVIDGSAFESKKEFYDYLGEALDLPEYAGDNLDALWDILRDRKDQEIVIEKARYIPIHLNQYGMAILDVFGDLDGENGMVVNLKW